MNLTKLVFVHALSPLHAGTGQGAGVIDLPIAREKATNLPYLPGSSLKGPLRDRATDILENNVTHRIFGHSEAENLTMGAVQFSDLHLLCLPVRSLYGTFAWVSSPYILNRFARGLADTNHSQLRELAPIQLDEATQCLVTQKSSLTANTKVYLEDLDFIAKDRPEVNQWGSFIAKNLFDSNKKDEKYWNDLFLQRLCIVHDNVLSFLLNTATEITARISLDDNKKTVKQGALWYEEALPAESILTGLMLIAPPKANQTYLDAMASDLEKLCEKPIQLGGKATVGRGICRVIVK
ncbi:type III-B CRISPR module RAMP protein Cmr4 [Herpetosiphon llansteffanensis]|uniref:type III-B CRISPR module RAMP protein Cmr4 n=1 Tax=Herpetosiphon llansteffanensis TaxID=2094568 RepID=UPI000D7CA617|nr:type III-B CRISPR module RAMP protein Cmr4 [Herpetosiphon llansteffanensis]